MSYGLCGASAGLPESALRSRYPGSKSLHPGSESSGRQQRAGDGHPLALTAGKLHASFADDRLVFIVEALDELLAMGDPADGPDLFLSRPRFGKADVVGNRSAYSGSRGCG